MMLTDSIILAVDGVLRSLWAQSVSARPTPGAELPEADLSAEERRHVEGLMRVNHSGEVCAQALYQGQSLFARSPQVRDELEQSAREEGDHLAWTRGRLAELGGATSRLDPLWFLGAYALGAAASALGDRVSLGFLQETERQVVAHLEDHLRRLPLPDLRSREILLVMRDDERAHAEKASVLGALPFPAPVRGAMQAMAKVMTTVAYRV